MADRPIDHSESRSNRHFACVDILSHSDIFMLKRSWNGQRSVGREIRVCKRGASRRTRELATATKRDGTEREEKRGEERRGKE